MERSDLDRRSVLRTGAIGTAAAVFISAKDAFAAAGPPERVVQALAKAKRSLPETQAFINSMPKGGDIHNHLEGDVYDTQALRSAIARGLNFDLGTDSFTDQPVGGNVIRSAEIESDDSLYLRFRDSFSAQGTRRSGKSGREQFFSTFGRVQSSRIGLSDVLAGVIRRASIEQISYVETIAPVIPNQWIERLTQRVADTWDGGIEPTLDAIQGELHSDEFKESVTSRLNGWENGTNREVVIRYLSYALRFLPLPQFALQAACAAAAVSADHRIVGFNLVGPEDSIIANRDFRRQLEIVDHIWQRFGNPNIALHAGELTQSEVTVEELHGRIRDSITLGHARRIGHGVSIAWDGRSDETLALMRRERIPVEICLTSNEVILGISGREHPIDLYRAADVPLIFGSDDEGITRSSLSSELAKAVFRYDLSYKELRNCIRNSLEYSFLQGASLFDRGNYDRMIGLGSNRSRNRNAMISAAEVPFGKGGLQLRLERDLLAFEARF